MFRRLEDKSYDTYILRREFIDYHEKFTTPERPVFKQNLIKYDSEILTEMLLMSDGIVVGEEHYTNTAAAFIHDQTEHLINLGVEIFFFEGLYFGNEKMLNNDIHANVPLEYQTLIKKLTDKNIEIIGIDTPGSKRGEGMTRAIFMNASAADIIKNTTKGRKWVALTGMMHISTQFYINPVTLERHKIHGIAEMTGSLSLIIDGSPSRYLKLNSEYKAAPAKYIYADIILGTGIFKEEPNTFNSLDEINKNLPDIIKITHYDIDSFLYKQNNKYIEGYSFAIEFNNISNSSILNIKNTAKQYCLQTGGNNNEVMFICQFNMLDNIIKLIYKELETVYNY